MSAMGFGLGPAMLTGGDRSPRSVAPRASRWLALAASPASAIMAVLSSVPGGGQPDMLCPAAGKRRGSAAWP